MTRARMYKQIKRRLDDYQLPADEATKEVVDAAVDAALEYVLEFSQQLAYELAASNLIDEARVAGIFTRKVKGLIDGSSTDLDK